MRRRKDGRGGADIGMEIITEAQMLNAAKILKRLLYSVAAESGIPGSVLAHVAEVEHSGISYSSDYTSATISLSFVGDLSRPSLVRRDGSSGDGVDDIVMLFNNGYEASSRVFGYYSGWGALKRDPSEGKSGDMMIASRISRPALNFLESAIEQFNSIYGPTYHCVASM